MTIVDIVNKSTLSDDGLAPESLLTNDLRLIARICLIASGLIIFVPSALHLFQSGDAGASDTLILMSTFVLWLSGWIPSARKWRAQIQVLAGVLLLALPFVIPAQSQVGWLSMSTIPFAIVFAAVFSLPAVIGAIAILAVFALSMIAEFATPTQFITKGDVGMPTWASPVFLVITGLALWLLLRRWWTAAQESDREFISLRRTLFSSVRTAQVREARTAVERKIHETVLNTLNAIAHGAGRRQPQLLQEECARDIANLESWEAGHELTTLDQVIAQAIEVAGIQDIEVSIASESQAALNSQILQALRDVLVESLRNVDRHAQASKVIIKTRDSKGRLSVSVVDNGRGINEEMQPRFGLRNTIIATIEALEGTVEIGSNEDGGTTISFDIPVMAPLESHMPSREAFALLFRDRFSRLLIVSPIFAGLILLPFTASFLNVPWLYVAFFFGFMACNVALATFWNTRPIVGFAYLGTLLAVAVNISALMGMNDCVSAISTNWTIVAVDGAIGLIVFALRGRKDMWVPIVLVFGSSCLVLWRTPTSCRNIAGVSFIDTMVYVGVATYVVIFLLNRIEARRAFTDDLWQANLAHHAVIEKEEARISGWDLVAAGTLQFFQEIAAGKLDLASPELEERARREEMRLRRDLGLSGEQTSGLWEAVVGASQTAALQGLVVHTVRLSELGNHTAVPERITEYLRELSLVAPSGTLQMRVFESDGIEELVVKGPRDALRGAAVNQGWTGSYESLIEDCTVEIYVGEPAQLSVRRPVRSIQ